MQRMTWPSVAIGLSLALVGAVLVLADEPGVTRTNFGRIQVGMHRSEVESIFAGPSVEPTKLPTRWMGLFLT